MIWKENEVVSVKVYLKLYQTHCGMKNSSYLCGVKQVLRT